MVSDNLVACVYELDRIVLASELVHEIAVDLELSETSLEFVGSIAVIEVVFWHIEKFFREKSVVEDSKFWAPSERTGPQPPVTRRRVSVSLGSVLAAGIGPRGWALDFLILGRAGSRRLVFFRDSDRDRQRLPEVFVCGHPVSWSFLLDTLLRDFAPCVLKRGKLVCRGILVVAVDARASITSNTFTAFADKIARFLHFFDGDAFAVSASV